MRWATYQSPTDGSERVGLLRDCLLLGLPAGETMLTILSGDGLNAGADRARSAPAEVVPVEGAKLLAPVPRPPSVRDFMAFEEHVVNSMRALGGDIDPGWYDAPCFYFTNPAAIRGPHDDICISPGSEAFDFELEVGVIIGRAGADVGPVEAENLIAGYVLLCDWSARDLQEREMKQMLGPAKGKDGATSLSGFLVTPDEIEDVRQGVGFDLRMTASVNGVAYSEGNFADIHWSFGEMISYASRGTTLMPGDVIGSGTVGTGCILELSRVHGPDRYPYLRPGDRVRLEIERIGAVESVIRPGQPPRPFSLGTYADKVGTVRDIEK